MHNIKLTISYQGTRYAGWQIQGSPIKISSKKRSSLKKSTVQAEVEAALAKITQKKIRVTASGRTDSGVHALNQVAHFKSEAFVDRNKLKKSLNAILPSDVSIRGVEEVDLTFHARFSTKSKIYRYVILNEEERPLFLKDLVHHVRFPLDVSKMRREARVLRGRHDFKAFQAKDKIERGSVRTIKRIVLKEQRTRSGVPAVLGRRFILIDIEADGFLFNMVRNIVGTLIDVGRGRFPVGSLQKILRAKDRAYAGTCAPADGLYLLKVNY